MTVGIARAAQLAMVVLALWPIPGACHQKEIDRIRERAELGYPQDQIELAAAYLTGRDVPQNAALAAHWYEKAAEAGDAKAANQIGFLYQSGIGVPANMERAFHFYQLAVSSGMAASKVNLAVLYLNGFGVQQNPAEARELLQDALSKGVGVAATYMGDMCLFGKGMPQDMAEAEKWYSLGVRLHDPLGAFNLAVLYANTPNHVRDPERAAELLRVSSAKGYVRAKHALGWLLTQHPELAQFPNEAQQVLGEAADAGHWQSSALLGVLARDGKVETADPAEAYFRFQAAALQGGETGQQAVANDLKALAAKLTSDQRQALTAKANAWYQHHRISLVFVFADRDARRDFPVVAGD